MKYRLLLFCLTLPFLFASKCGEETDDCHRNVTIVNNSDKELFITKTIRYPDSISYLGHQWATRNIIGPRQQEKYALYGAGDCAEVLIGYENEYGIMMIFAFDNNIVRTTPWETIVANRMYLKKYDLSVDDLQKMNWTITYP